MKKSLTALNVLSRLVGVMVIALTLSVSPVHAQTEEPQEDTTGLFSPAEPPSDEAVQAAADDPSVLRYRFVNVDLAQLNPVLDPETAGTPVTFNLFPDANFSVVFTQIEPTISDGTTLTGSVVGIEDSNVILSIVGGIVAGSIQTPTGVYDFRYTPSGVYVLRQIQESRMPGEFPLSLSPEPTIDTIQALVGDDTGEQIDILVVYTTSARDAAGGSVAMNSLISSAVGYTNTAYENSGIHTHMYLSETQWVQDYTESSDWVETLYDLTFTSSFYPADGPAYPELDIVHSYRDMYTADLVVLAIYDPLNQYCGLGWTMNRNFEPVGTYSFSDFAYSVVDYRCLSGRTLAHETGHNMGADHDRYVYEDFGANYGGAFSYSFGNKIFEDNVCEYYTIMAYADGYDNGTYFVCNEGIPYFSNPDVTYNGYPTGIASGASSANVALTINNTASTVARYRDGRYPAAPDISVFYSEVPGQLNIHWQAPHNTYNAQRAYVIEYQLERSTGNGWTLIATIPDTGVDDYYFSDVGLTCGQEYDYRVRARNGNGISAYGSSIQPYIACWVPTPTYPRVAYYPDQNSNSRVFFWTYPSYSYEEGFYVERSLHSQNEWVQLATVSANITEYFDYDTQCGMAYDYRVRAFQGTYISSYSQIATTTINICLPPTPIGFSATTISQSQINLSWVDPTDDPRYEETNFLIYRNVNGSNFTSLVNLPSGSTIYNNSGLSCGTTYGYRLNSRNASGNSESVTIYSTTNPCGPPEIPDNFDTQAVSQYDVLVTWLNVEDETGYYLERSEDGVTWTQIAALPADSSQYVDSHLTPGTQYFYRVRSANSYSVEPYTYTDPASATTFTLGFYVPIVQNP